MQSVIQSNQLVSPLHFINSAKAVFATMVGCQLEVGEVIQNPGFRTKHELSGIIGFTGRIQATVVISLDKEIAFAAAEAFLGDKFTEINADILDLVGELSNMIAGGARERLNETGVSLGLPTAISGKDHVICFDAGIEITQIPFTTPWGNMTVEFGARLGKD